jgi:hypothetical protein
MASILVVLLGFCVWGAQAREWETPPPMPMQIDESNAAPARWIEAKGVLASRLVDDMETPAHWTHHGFGEMSFTSDRSRDGAQSIRLTSPTVAPKPGAVTGRPFGEAELRCNVANEDWSAYNRLSFWVYPTLPGFKVISMLVVLHNNGDVKVPDAYGREGLNFFLLKPGQWNQVVWEIPHLSRDKVTGVSFIYRLQGNEPGAATQVCYDIDRLELQQVVEDHYEGWNVQPGAIAFSTTGYDAGGPKSALAADLKCEYFELINMDTGVTVATRPVRTVTTAVGTLQKLDFSDIREPGRYVIKAGSVVTPEFRISADVWRETIWKTINFFYCERCGTAIPGIHDLCHKDWNSTYKAKTIPINGGWHDAGDLSQGLINTAEATYAMIALADQLNQNAALLQRPEIKKHSKQTSASPPAANQDPDPLARRLIEEARWGLDWVLKTRFGDGARTTWATMDYWTDGIPGTVDDAPGDVHDSPFENFTGASTEALAAAFFRDRDPALSARCLLAAQQDWEFALKKMGPQNLELAAAGTAASMELYHATQEKKYSAKAMELAEVILNCQQREYQPWRVPLAGYFYTTPQHDHLLHYIHRGHDQAAITALADLCQTFPNETQWIRWYSAVAGYSEFLKATARYTDPYGMIPSGIYDLNENQEAWYQEQVRNGMALDSRHYLKMFPAWTSFRGNHGTILSQTKALSTAAQLRRDLDSGALAQQQLQWVVGRNPFAQSTMYGEGHDFAPQYTAMSGNMVGSLPVGIETRADNDIPYWPAANCYNYKEVWVHPSSRWLSLMVDLNGPAIVSGVGRPAINRMVEFTEVETGRVYTTAANQKSGEFVIEVPQGRYRITHGERSQTITVLPGSRRYLDLRETFTVDVNCTTSEEGRVTITVSAQAHGTHRFVLRSSNLRVDSESKTLELNSIAARTVTWKGLVINVNEPWFGVILPDETLAQRVDVWGTAARER